ncbi:transcriptional regulator, XRE family [Pyrolobus fumarii 1A]|uniref:Putative HTH-type transcriptional regulatory protein Pyrfu_1117 n=1 Tax=Pyrolobus fumarii (strain DSM 11204 / 1A) TaxID=694429 RepID=G0EFG0_PYRF1|nr:helix-turn-helix domain-containing protein [Pyrolobus fumarii]AEM38984.1 transcriptional regulator, XRE family [Pyrolobus fumarii 1A]
MTGSGYNGAERVLERLIGVLERLGYGYHVLEYPENRRRRSIDVLVAGGGRRVLIKVVEDVASVRREDVKELRSVGGVLGASPLLVGDHEKGEKLEDIVAYERMGIYALSPEGFERAASTGIFVVKKRGRFYMRLDAGKFKEEREARGLSLGTAADLLGVTRRAVYEYERSNIDVDLERALRILDVFGEEVFRPIEVFRVEEPRSELRNLDEEGERAIAERIMEAGGIVVHAKRTVVDLAARLGERTSIIVYEHRRERTDGVIRRGEEAARIAEATSSEVIAIVERSETARDLEALGLHVIRGSEAPDEITIRLREYHEGL